VLELPPFPGDAQRIFPIQRKASYVIAVRNPARFGRRRFNPVDPPQLLNYEGAEVVIIGAAADAEGELGIARDAETQRIEDADLFGKLRRPAASSRSSRWNGASGAS
jgi:hypothetical protein